MEKVVVIGDQERVTPEDFNNFGLFPRSSIDHLVKDLGIPDYGFSGFNVAGDVASALLNVGGGRLYVGTDEGTPVFANYDDGGVQLNILKDLPVITRKIFTVYAYGDQKNDEGEARTFLTNALTRDTVGKIVSTTNVRRAEIKAVGGIEGPDPQAPALPSGAVPIAYVETDKNGILTISRELNNVVPNIRELDNARRENLAWREKAGTKIETLGTDISALAARIQGVASAAFVREVAGDVARLKLKVQLPQSYSSYHSDTYLTDALTETTHVDNLCQIKEGIRFAPANSSDSQLGLVNSLDPKVIVNQGFVLPAYDEVVRLACPEADAEISLSQYTFTNQTVTIKTKPVTRIQYGTPFSVCSNDANFWRGATWDFWNNTVYKDGIAYNVINQVDIDTPNHTIWRLQQVWTDTIQEPYTDIVTTTDVANGSQCSESVLNTQDGWCTAIDFRLTKVAAAGDVTLLLTETTNAAPDAAKTLLKVTVPANKLVAGLNTAPIQPVMMKKGFRYGVFVITAGNHFMGITKNNKYTNGSMFVMSDGAFQVGSLTDDLCIGLRFAKFRSSYVEVDLLPLQLGGGIAAIDIWANMVITAGTQLVFSVLDPANNVWKALDATSTGGGTALGGLPPLVRMKATLIGTPDLMPGFDTSYTARARCWRPRTDGKHVSKVFTTPAPVKNIIVTERLENWRGAGFHTHDCKLLTGPLLTTGVGDTVVLKASMTEIPAPDNPTYAVVRTYTFVLATAVSAFRFRQDINTTNALSTFHVAEHIDVDQP